jgi:hypothetical protein
VITGQGPLPPARLRAIHVLAQALAAATVIDNEYTRARALADLAPMLPARLLPQ